MRVSKDPGAIEKIIRPLAFLLYGYYQELIQNMFESPGN